MKRAFLDEIVSYHFQAGKAYEYLEESVQITMHIGSSKKDIGYRSSAGSFVAFSDGLLQVTLKLSTPSNIEYHGLKSNPARL